MRFAILQLHLCKVLRLPRKSDARSYEVLYLSHKIILANLKIWCSEMQPFSGNQRPDLLTSLMNMSIILPLLCKMNIFFRFSSNVPRLPSFLNMPQHPHVLLTLTLCTIPCACHAKRHLNTQKRSEHVVLLAWWRGNVLRAPTPCTFSTSQLPKVVREWCALYIWLPNVLRATTACTFSQKWIGPGVFCTFWLGNVLRATTACNLSSLIWPDGSAPAALASLPFDPPEPQIIGKNTVFRDFPTFSRICIFFLRLSLFWSSFFFSSLLFSSLTLPFSAFHLSIFVGSLTSKLPSVIIYIYIILQ